MRSGGQWEDVLFVSNDEGYSCRSIVSIPHMNISPLLLSDKAILWHKLQIFLSPEGRWFACACVCLSGERECQNHPWGFSSQHAVVFKQTDSSGHVCIAHCVKKQKDSFCCNPDVTVTQLWEHPRILVIQVPSAKAAPRYAKRNKLCFYSLRVSSVWLLYCRLTVLSTVQNLNILLQMILGTGAPPAVSAICETKEWRLTPPCCFWGGYQVTLHLFRAARLAYFCSAFDPKAACLQSPLVYFCIFCPYSHPQGCVLATPWLLACADQTL